MAEDWQDVWQPMIDAVGTDFGGGVKHVAVEAIEKNTIRRFCEPLEMDCPIFYDEEVAKAHGYRGIPAPWSGITQTWTDQGVWQPGQQERWPEADRDAPVVRELREGGVEPPVPETSGGFATDIEVEYIEDAVVGDRLHEVGNTLVSCTPKETSVGRGAFVIYEWEVRNQDDTLIAKCRRGLYGYTPFEK